MAWTTPRTWVAAETVTAALLNTHVRDNLDALTTWATDWTPTWTGGTTNPAIGNGTILGRYIEAGKLVHFYAQITMGSTTTYGSGIYSIDLPVAPVARYFRFTGILNDASAGYYEVVGGTGASSSVFLRVDPTTAGNQLRSMTGTTPVTLTTGDVIWVGGTYEAA